MAIIIQQDATEYILFNLSSVLHVSVGVDPSLGAHNTVSTVSGINETGTATCRERGWAGTVLGVLVLCIDRYWGVHPKHVEQLTD